ncbi:HDOD domain-containing protein [Neptuniibacter sp.]|uniref:HDOD domain-containing protein n=1 Tax=Neptuniibacter sp. TaxID=1962643 RepID=UPI002635F6DF|nr:HDOD domain-containing protein [Neptuniibacter sp.]MCP4596568.1 HDOD domain-containing protein [Neptuniibacter sp.]
MTTKRKLTLSIVEKRVEQLPLLPAVVCDLMTLDPNSSHFYDKVTELSESDPPLATRVLKIVNSAAAAPSHTITDLHEALIRVGVNKILYFITSVSVSKVFTPATDQQKAIWQHSIETAHIAEFIADNMPDFHVDKHMAFTCGLLHDIGRFVLFEITAKAIEVVDSKGWDTPIELPDVERNILGFTHAEVGYLAAKKWQLPKLVVELIHHHHNYGLWQTRDVPESFKQLLTVVQFADFLSVLIEKNPDWPTWDREKLRAQITETCLYKAWPVIPFPIDQLVDELPAIAVECHQIMEKLRLS